MIAIIDYGMGNLRSVQKAFEKVGHEALVTCDPAEVRGRRRWCCRAWGRSKTPSPNCDAAVWSARCSRQSTRGKPFLGICLGLQLLFDVGYENGRHEGLGVIPGEVVRFRRARPSNRPPHGVESTRHSPAGPDLRGDRAEGRYFYFVHSYYVVPREPR